MVVAQRVIVQLDDQWVQLFLQSMQLTIPVFPAYLAVSMAKGGLQLGEFSSALWLTLGSGAQFIWLAAYAFIRQHRTINHITVLKVIAFTWSVFYLLWEPVYLVRRIWPDTEMAPAFVVIMIAMHLFVGFVALAFCSSPPPLLVQESVANTSKRYSRPF